jgi:phosphatidylinositol glycan class T
VSSSTLVGQERTDAQFPPNLILQEFRPPLLRHLLVVGFRISTMLPLGLVLLLASSSLGTQAVRGASSTFSEDLALRPLPDGKVDAFLTFSINSTARVAGASCESLSGMPDICVESEPDHGPLTPSSLPPSHSAHDTLAPSSLLSLLHNHQADSFELALTSGTWQHSRWGYPLSETGGSGAEMWASMGDAPKSVPSSHRSLYKLH